MKTYSMKDLETINESVEYHHCVNCRFETSHAFESNNSFICEECGTLKE